MPVGPPSGLGSASSHYELLARLATGGMAEIFLARANSLAGLERYVVLKRIRPDCLDEPRWVTMFLDEARLAAQLQHPNIASVFDLGQIGDDYFYTMEYVHGTNALEMLDKSVERGEPMPLDVVLAIACGALAGLAHAHDRRAPDGRPLGIVHRDVSPANLMVSFEGTVKVVDFGVAKARSRSTETEAGTIMGKLAYLSPEHIKNGTVDRRSDIFSLGIVMWELLTNTRLFKRDTDYDTLRAVVRDRPAPPSTLAEELLPGIDEIVLTALEKNPRDRFATATDMLDAIEAIVEADGMSLTPGVLRRFMTEMWGSRSEPWRVLEDPRATDDRPVGFPMDASADDVPLLGLTGLVDVEALSTIRPRAPTHLDSDDLPAPLRHSEPPPPVPVEALRPPITVDTPRSRSTPMPVQPLRDLSPIARRPVAEPTELRRVPPSRSTSRAALVALAVVAAVVAVVIAIRLLRGNDAGVHAAAAAGETAPRPAAAPVTVTPIDVPVATPPPVSSPPAPLPAATRRPPPAPPSPPPVPTTKRAAAKPPAARCADPLDCQF